MLAGCSADATTDAGGDQDIINGVDATSAEYNAIGLLVIVGNDHTEALCTGTLIAPNVVLTAKHCAMKNPSQEGSPTNVQNGKVYFLVGPNGQHPAAYAQASEATPSHLFQGGFTSLGSDVALYTLAQPITSVEPLKVADSTPSQADVNTPFIGIGYGIQDAAGTTGTRKMGQVTLRAVTGAPAPLAFATADDYLASIVANIPAGHQLTDAQKAGIKAQFQSPMSDSYEVYVGGAPGDSQICHGDSGGPLLRKENGKYVVHGVASTTMAQTGNICKSGGMYAVFGASTRELIAEKIGDHCKVDDSSSQLVCGQSVAPTSCTFLAQQQAANGPDATPPSPFVACLSTSCCAETTACFADQGCAALSQCFQDCSAAGGDTTTQQTCSRNCYNANAGSYEKYLGFQKCGSNNCSSASAPSTGNGSTTEGPGTAATR